MLGGITSSVHRLSVLQADGTPTQVVLKRFADPAYWDAHEIVRNEAAALAAIEATDVPAPRLLGVAANGADTDGMPSLLMTRVAGRVWLTPPDLDRWVGQLAAQLPIIHAAEADVWLHQTREVDALTVPSSAVRPEVWTAARRFLATERPAAKLVLTHGDYQHFNVLWSRGRLSGLVDWSCSRLAPPDVDVGHCRLNLAVLFSAEVAERFRFAYESEAGRCIDPWWDIHELLAYGDDWRAFIPVQVAGRAPFDAPGMTRRVEELLTLALRHL